MTDDPTPVTPEPDDLPTAPATDPDATEPHVVTPEVPAEPEPEAPQEAPVAATSESTVEEPTAPVEEPGSAAEEPTSAVEEPEPAAPVDEPVAAVEESTAAAEEPTSAAEEPTSAAGEPEPAAPVDEPTVVAEGPAAVAEEPTAAVEEPQPTAPADETTGAEETATEQPPAPVPTPAEIVAHPATPGVIPSPAMFAKHQSGPSLSAFGRVGDDGVVYVKTPDGEERAVGSYPGATPGGALAYFGRKYDEISAAADLLQQRLAQTDVSAKDAEESFAKLTEQAGEGNAVGDLAALTAKLAEIGEAVSAKKAEESQQRAVAREEGRQLRETLVAEAEKIAAQSPERTQWKTSGARMRELLDDWKQHQRSGTRLDRPTETALWQRFSAARNSFDRARRVHFAQLDGQQSEAKAAKTRLVAEAERLSSSKDWAPTAGAFKKLMDEWRRAGRAGRADDDALWERFRAAQDAFFTAKDAVVAAEEESFRGNLTVKDQLLVEAEQILPVRDLERAKASLRSIQDRWDKAGKVPRADIDRTEKALRRVEQAVRDAEEKRWSSSNPEAAARAQSLVDQLESAVAGLRADLEKAESSGNAKKIDQARAALEAREAWLSQARAGLEEFGG